MKTKGKKMITGISGFGFLVQKWPFRDAHLRFLGQVVKKKILDTRQKKEKFDW